MSKRTLILYILLFILSFVLMLLTIISCQMDNNESKTENITPEITIKNEEKTPEETPIQTLEKTETPEVTTKTPEIELIEVESIDFKNLHNDGVVFDYTITKESDFYEALEVVYMSQKNLKVQPNNVLNFDYTIKVGESFGDHVTGKLYVIDEYTNYWDLITYDNENNPATLKHYIHTKNIDKDNYIRESYYVYSYKNELAMDAISRKKTDGVYEEIEYLGKYPTAPEGGTQFYFLLSSMNVIVGKYSSFDLFQHYQRHLYVDSSGEKQVLDFDQHTSRTFKLYKDYIVFEQTSPFSGPLDAFTTDRKIEYYNSCLKMNAYFTQTVMFNLKTKSIEKVSIKAHTISAIIRDMEPLDINLSIQVKPVKNYSHITSVTELIDFIKQNAKE